MSGGGGGGADGGGGGMPRDSLTLLPAEAKRGMRGALLAAGAEEETRVVCLPVPPAGALEEVTEVFGNLVVKRSSVLPENAVIQAVDGERVTPQNAKELLMFLSAWGGGEMGEQAKELTLQVRVPSDSLGAGGEDAGADTTAAGGSATTASAATTTSAAARSRSPERAGTSATPQSLAAMKEFSSLGGGMAAHWPDAATTGGRSASTGDGGYFSGDVPPSVGFLAGSSRTNSSEAAGPGVGTLGSAGGAGGVMSQRGANSVLKAMAKKNIILNSGGADSGGSGPGGGQSGADGVSGELQGSTLGNESAAADAARSLSTGNYDSEEEDGAGEAGGDWAAMRQGIPESVPNPVLAYFAQSCGDVQQSVSMVKGIIEEYNDLLSASSAERDQPHETPVSFLGINIAKLSIGPQRQAEEERRRQERRDKQRQTPRGQGDGTNESASESERLPSTDLLTEDLSTDENDKSTSELSEVERDLLQQARTGRVSRGGSIASRSTTTETEGDGDAEDGDDEDAGSVDIIMEGDGFPAFEAEGPANKAEYSVSITSRYLGVTVENVMERTVVRKVHTRSEAERVGVTVDSLLIQIGDRTTADLSHMETLELLRHAARPLQLCFRRIDNEKLNRRRAEMRALIQPHSKAEDGSELDGTLIDWVEERVVAVLRVVVVGLCLLKSEKIKAKADAKRRQQQEQQKQDQQTARNADEAEDDKAAAEAREREEQEEAREYADVAVALDLLARAEEAMIVSSSLLSSRLSVLGEILHQLHDALNWSSEVVRAVERDLRDIVCMLLQLDQDFIFGPRGQTVQPVAILKKIFSCLSDGMVLAQSIPLLCRLGSSASLSSRTACAELIPILYPSVDLTRQLQLRGLLNRLTQDRTVVVRECAVRAATSCIHRVDAAALPWLLMLCELASTDEDARVRLSALEFSLEFIQRPPKALIMPEGDGGAGAAVRADGSTPVQANAQDQSSGASSSSTEAGSRRSKSGDGFAVSADHSLSIRTFTDDVYTPTKDNLGSGPGEVSFTRAGLEKEMHLIYCRTLPVATRLAEDPEPLVRAEVARKCDSICISMGWHWAAVVVDLLMGLLRDPEENVRCESLASTPRLARSLLSLSRDSAPPNPLSPPKEQARPAGAHGEEQDGAAAEDNTDEEARMKHRQENGVESSRDSLGARSRASGRSMSMDLREAHSKILDCLLPGACALANDKSVEVRVALAGVLSQILAIVCDDFDLSADAVARAAARAHLLAPINAPGSERVLPDDAPQLPDSGAKMQRSNGHFTDGGRESPRGDTDSPRSSVAAFAALGGLISRKFAAVRSGGDDSPSPHKEYAKQGSDSSSGSHGDDSDSDSDSEGHDNGDGQSRSNGNGATSTSAEATSSGVSHRSASTGSRPARLERTPSGKELSPAEAMWLEHIASTVFARVSVHLIPVMMMLLTDKSAVVSTTMLKTLSPVADPSHASWMSVFFTRDHVYTMTRALESLAKSEQWRTRQAVSCLVPTLVVACQTLEGRNRVAALVRPLLNREERVYEVRKTAATSFCRAASADFVKSSVIEATHGMPAEALGRMWLDTMVLPMVEELRTARHYLDRILSLHMVGVLLKEDLVQDTVRSELLLNLALMLAVDAVPNVRIALMVMLDHVINTVGTLSAGPLRVPEEVDLDANTDEVRFALSRAGSSAGVRALQTLREYSDDMYEDDRDVRHFARAAWDKALIALDDNHDIDMTTVQWRLKQLRRVQEQQANQEFEAMMAYKTTPSSSLSSTAASASGGKAS